MHQMLHLSPIEVVMRKYSALMILMGGIFFSRAAHAAEAEPKNCEQFPTLQKQLECLSRPIQRPQPDHAANPRPPKSEGQRAKEEALRRFDQWQREQRKREILEFCERNPNESFCQR